MSDLVPYGEDSPFALLRMEGQEVRDLLQDTLGADGISASDLDRVKVPSGGGTTWEIPTLDGDVATKELEAVILHDETRRVYWPYAMEERPDDEDGRPHCFSTDGVTGQGKPGGDCRTCPFNVFGTDVKGGPGKACKEQRQLFLLMKADLLPLTLNVPPGSLGSFKAYKMKLIRGQVAPTDTVTKITLKKEKNQGNVSFARMEFLATERLDPDAKVRVRDYKAMLMPGIRVDIPDA